MPRDALATSNSSPGVACVHSWWAACRKAPVNVAYGYAREPIMLARVVLMLFASAIAAGVQFIPHQLPTAEANSNTAPAGVLENGLLQVTLDAQLAMWHPDGDTLPGIPVKAFGEPGRAPQIPGPLIRIPLGTTIRTTVRNRLTRDTIIYDLRVGEIADTMVVLPGAEQVVVIRPTRAGTFAYRAATSGERGSGPRIGGGLTGALIVDSAGHTGPPTDRVFVLWGVTDSASPNTSIPVPGRTIWTITDDPGRTRNA